MVIKKLFQVSDIPYETENIEAIPSLPYEFPNGYNREFGSERFKITEGLFDPSCIKVSFAAVNKLLPLVHSPCDIDF